MLGVRVVGWWKALAGCDRTAKTLRNKTCELAFWISTIVQIQTRRGACLPIGGDGSESTPSRAEIAFRPASSGGDSGGASGIEMRGRLRPTAGAAAGAGKWGPARDGPDAAGMAAEDGPSGRGMRSQDADE